MYANEDLASIHVVILTVNEAERSFLESYDIPANRYFSKPLILSRYDQLIRLMNLVGKEPARIPIPQVEEQAIEELAQGKKRSWWPFGG